LDKEKEQQAKAGKPGSEAEEPYTPPESTESEEQPDYIDFTLHNDDGGAIANVDVRIHLASGETLDARTDGSGNVHIDQRPQGAYTVEVLGTAEPLTTIDFKVEDDQGQPSAGAAGTVTLSDGTVMKVMTDAHGQVRLTDVPGGKYTFKLDDPKGAGSAGDNSEKPDDSQA
jgi:hypothetical protein